MPSTIANVLLIAGGLASVGAAQSYSNGAITETVAPQELASMTSDGAVLYTMNMCTIVRSTHCQLSTSTSTGSVVPPSTGLRIGSSVDKATSTEPAVGPTTLSRGNSSVTTTRKVLTATESIGYWPSTSTYSPMPTSTGASNTVSVMRGVAVGAGAMAVAFLL
ncbi:hypothetical protein CDD80_4246 [Ophiocordyceps camponoti-rufipedis]|uniref:Uncharacterized protein n=1 Tax=Ophiocordyceps camponoti-rufipedis TaxID=2004952 RepID=A0A2C5YZN2_9HYPO|nr:hypothetical protein CDD80_4246 [Ophiocordyceps camponoti-rufipedis]